MTKFIEIYCSDSCTKKTSDTQKIQIRPAFRSPFFVIPYYYSICSFSCLLLSIEIPQDVFKTSGNRTAFLNYLFHKSWNLPRFERKLKIKKIPPLVVNYSGARQVCYFFGIFPLHVRVLGRNIIKVCLPVSQRCLSKCCSLRTFTTISKTNL